MRYTIGLDIGIASIGWAVINEDKQRIEDLGVRTFKKAEKEKDGKPLNEKRREARGFRRRTRRRAIRMQKIKDLFVKYELLSKQDLENLYNITEKDKDVWELRKIGLDCTLNNKEWARVLTSIAKRRGYKSNRKIEAEEAEGGKLLKGTSETKRILEENNYRTIGEMFFLDDKFENNKRNKAGEYNNTVLRSLLREEIKILFSNQRELGNKFAGKEFEDEYLKIFDYQKDFITEELLNKMLGRCTFEKSEQRAPKNSYTFERFMLLQKVNSLGYYLDNKPTGITKEEKDKIVNLAYNQKTITYTSIRRLLKLPIESKFVGLNYYVKSGKDLSEEEITKKVETDNKFVELQGYNKLKDAFKENEKLWEEIKGNTDILDIISDALLRNKTDENIINYLVERNISKEVSDIVTKVNFTKVGHLSYVAMKKINPFLEQGLTYDKACEKAGYEFKGVSNKLNKKLPTLSEIGEDTIRNAVVLRAIAQTRKVINAIIEKYDSPTAIYIETARDLSKNFDERRSIEKKQKENQQRNEIIKKEIKESFNIDAKPIDIVKYKLWSEQNHMCAYSRRQIKYEQLYSNKNEVQVDHIIPFSRSFDDSYFNKVLVFTDENQKKKERTPYEYIGQNEERWHEFEVWVESTYKNNPKKKSNLLNKNFDEEKSKDFIARNLNDTRYIARFMSNYIANNLEFTQSELKRKVYTINGAATDILRKQWGISKNRKESDKHHAQDAVVIALSTQKNIQRVSECSKYKKLDKNNEYINKETGEIIQFIKEPWINFREELECRIGENPSYALKHGKFTNYDDVDVEHVKPVFISRMPERKISGQAHQETLRSQKFMKKGLNYSVVKKNLNSITDKEIKSVVNDDSFKDLYISDRYTYDAIYNRMREYNFDSKKAFSDFVLRKPGNSENSPVVRSIKVPTVTYSGIEIKANKAIADNASMVRVDVYNKDNKYYLIPIYVADFVKREAPNKYIVGQKPEAEWKEIEEDFFIFSLYPNDLIKFKKKNEKEKFAYYVKTNRTNAQFDLINHDNSEAYLSVGVQNLELLEKYEVDVLGNCHKVKKEKRRWK